MPPDLPTGYYLDNFNRLLESALQTYGDLLSGDELGFCETFRSLGIDAQRLYVRLVMRKGPLFRADRLDYPEISRIDEAARHLLEAGLMDDGRDQDEGDVHSLLTRRDLLDLLAGETGTGLTRDQLLERVLEHHGDGLRDSLPFEIYRPLHDRTLLVLRLLFFGNLHQDLTEFVITDLGLVLYENYALGGELRQFNDRAVIDRALELHELARLSHELVEAGDTGGILAMTDRLSRPEAERFLESRRNRIVNRLARQLERCGLLEEALEIYATAVQAPARERRIRVLVRLERYEEALALCEIALEDPADEAELEYAQRCRDQLERRLRRRTGAAARANITYSTEAIVLAADPDSRVEQLAAEYYGADGRCFYVENHLFNGLFGLAIWDILFHPYPGAFFNAYQRGPADLYTPDFHRLRRHELAERLLALQQPDCWREHLTGTYRRKQGLANHFVHWQYLTPELLAVAVERIPAPDGVAIFRRLLSDLRANRSGFPDLVHFPDAGGYELIEVKGPGDRLQLHQRRWQAYFHRYRIPARVVDVTWAS